jgi:[ribosomal protein S5]-alanine N-acetyltransferase
MKVYGSGWPDFAAPSICRAGNSSLGEDRSVSVEIPSTLSTERLTLRPLAASDLPALHGHWTDPEVRRFLWDGEIVPRDRVRAIIDESDTMFGAHGAGLWRVRPVDDAELIGCAGFWFFHEPPQLELLVSLSPACWGRGFAREAATALIDFAFESLGWEAIQASADAPNEASLGLMRRLGMREVGRVPGEFGTIDIYRISCDEWSRGTARG